MAKQPQPPLDGEYPIRTIYYADAKGHEVIKITRARWANNAVPNCIRHMQVNEYAAKLAEVHDTSNGDLHAVITHNVAGEIKILFKREVHEGM